jgi:hypothetical protein
VLPKSSWNTRSKEQKGVPGDIVVHLGGENLELGYPPRESCMCGQSLMTTRVEHGGYHHDQWSSEAIYNITSPSLLVLDVQMKLLQMCGPLLMAIILQIPLCLYEL